jgi:hypothetical protein
MKHTKGPWKANLAPRLNVKGPDKKSICAIVSAAGKKTRPYEEHCANANLIAAAPELLVNLKIALNALEYRSDTNPNLEYMKNIVNTIAKAEGKSK